MGPWHFPFKIILFILNRILSVKTNNFKASICNTVDSINTWFVWLWPHYRSLLEKQKVVASRENEKYRTGLATVTSNIGLLGH